MRKAFPLFAIVAGLFWVVMSFDYGLWVRRGPGGGFFPLIGGALTVIFGAFYLWGEIRKPQAVVVDKKFCYPILATLGVILASYLVGLLPAMFIYILFWLWKYEKFGYLYSIFVAACTVGALYGVFVYWLSVPLPKGVILPMIAG